MQLFSQKITLFLVLGIIVIALGIPFAIYYSRRDVDVTGMGTGFLIVVVLLAIVMIALDRLAVRVVAPGWLSLIELVIALVGGTWYSYANRSVTVDWSANPAPYFVVIWTKDGHRNPALQRKFPFDQIAVLPTGNTIQLDRQLFSITAIKTPAHWQTQFSFGIDLTHPRFESAYFYGPEAWSGKPAEVDKLLREAVARQPDR